MSASNFNLRGIPEEMMTLLRREAKRLHISINSLILKILGQDLGIMGTKVRPVFHDLDYLAGTWKREDAKEFQENTKSFEQIDEDLWR